MSNDHRDNDEIIDLSETFTKSAEVIATQPAPGNGEFPVVSAQDAMYSQQAEGSDETNSSD